MGPVAFDLSTTPIGGSFYAEGRAPSLLAAAVYFIEEDRYADFLPSDITGLLEAIVQTEELVSFSGKNLDLLVLRQHHGLQGEVPAHGVHTDMLEVLRPYFGSSLTLNDATQRFLGERAPSLPEFREARNLPHDPVARTDALAKCHEDIRQTVALWRLWKAGALPSM